MEKIIRKFNSHEEMRLHQLREWQKMPVEAIMDHAWEMVVEYREMINLQPHNPRLIKKLRAFAERNFENLMLGECILAPNNLSSLGFEFNI